MRGRPAGRERTLDVSQQLAGGTINFQGRVLRVRKTDASVTAGAARVNGFGARRSSAIGTWQLGQFYGRTDRTPQERGSGKSPHPVSPKNREKRMGIRSEGEMIAKC